MKKGSITAEAGRSISCAKSKRKVPRLRGLSVTLRQETYDALLELSPTRMSIMPLYARAETPFEFENPEQL